MHIDNLLAQARTVNKKTCGSKKKVLEVLAQLIAADHSCIDEQTLFEHFIVRERLGSTGIGSGIAIPHCRFNTQGQTLGALITLDKAIDFDAIDSKPVDIIFAMLVPENAETEHLQTLANLAQTLQQEFFTDALRESRSDNELYETAISYRLED